MRFYFLIAASIAMICIFQNCGAKDSVTAQDGPSTAQASPPEINSCNIQGGAGAQLVPYANTTRVDCLSLCEAQSATHPNLNCSWGNENLAAVNTCDIAGGAGATFFIGYLTQGQCNDKCQVNIGAHPNLSCLWAGLDLAPTGSCLVVGGAGALLFSGTDTHGQCYNHCQANLSAHPNEVCTWNGIKFN